MTDSGFMMQTDAATTAPLWVPAPLPPCVPALGAAGLPDWLAAVLARRGAETEAEAKAFLEPSLDLLHDPGKMSGIAAAVERLMGARTSRERVAIVGDYDVDGVTGTALLAAVFDVCGLETEVILPHRLEEGYGFQPIHVDAAAEQSCSLIVTVDCGSTAHDAMHRARQQGVDVIVTDHHLSHDPLPDWIIEINPCRKDCTYPFSELSGAGVAFKLAVSLAARVGRTIDQSALLRITCLGTICDLVPLVGENRAIAALGLAALAETRSPGLQALIQRAGIHPPFQASDVGFRLGPRLNAAGRLASAKPALDLLLTRDAEVAAVLADELETRNRQRQGAEMQVVEEAEAAFSRLHPMPAMLVGWSSQWHRGVVGIAAGRIARRFHRPTLLLTVEGERATGSGRSIRGIDLHGFLSRWESDYERFGGHTQAVGLTVSCRQLESLRDGWQRTAAEEWGPEVLARRLEYELALGVSDVDANLYAQLQRLEPFGVGNRKPILKVGPMSLEGLPRFFGRGHLAARATGGAGGSLRLLGWRWQDRKGDLEGDFEALGCLEADRYQGGTVLRLLDARPS